jgi:hypothetical protein
VSAFRYISRRGACQLCGGVADCRVNDRGGVHCRRTERNAPPAGWIYAGKDDGEGFGVYWPDDGRAPNERRNAAAANRVDAARRAAAEAKAAGKPAPTTGGALSFEEIERCRATLSPTQRATFVHEMLAGVSTGPAALAALDVQFIMDAGGQSGRWAYVFPERDGAERTTGYNLRFRDSRKLTYGPRGLFIPSTWATTNTPVFVAEGVSDTLALTAIGVAALGRANNTGGGVQLAELLVRYGFTGGDVCGTRDVYILGENDEKPNGTWPGRDGAERVASQLAEALGRPVAIAYPPAGVKDVREWLAGRRGDLEAGTTTPADLGAAWLDHCRRTATLKGGAATPPPLPPYATPPPSNLPPGLALSINYDYRPAPPAVLDCCPNAVQVLLRRRGTSQLLVVSVSCNVLACSYCGHRKRALYLETIAKRLADAAAEGLETVYTAVITPADWPRVGRRLSRAGADYFRVSLADGRFIVVATDPPAAGDASGVSTLTVAEAAAKLRVAVSGLPVDGGIFASSRGWRLLEHEERGEPAGYQRVSVVSRAWHTVAEAHAIDVRAAGVSRYIPERQTWAIGALPPGMSVDHLASDFAAGVATPPGLFDGGGEENPDDTGGGASGGTIDYTRF